MDLKKQFDPIWANFLFLYFKYDKKASKTLRIKTLLILF